ncbi:hypothetical protein YSY43_10020 [Paenibacillus sp. YSY-4.3]
MTINKAITADKPTLYKLGTPRDENIGATTKKAVIRQKTSKKTEIPCTKISIILFA